jgi:epoxyqueuosine reductase
LTIELRGPVPPELRPHVGDWLLGCDVCQDVCPWNTKAPEASERELWPKDGMNPVELASLFLLDDAAFRRKFRDTPLWRPRRRGILRNAAIVLGNRPDASAVVALVAGLNDTEPLVRGACAWALGQFPWAEAHIALLSRIEIESDSEVRDELVAASKSHESRAFATFPGA